MGNFDDLTLLDATIGIITALPEEYAAVTKAFGCDRLTRHPGIGAGRTYSLGKVQASGGRAHLVAVTQLVDMGNSSAASRATLLFEHCPNVKHIIMCGIAGGVPHPSKPEQHVRLGDIVVSGRNGVIQYDLVKEEWNEVTFRTPPRPPSASLLEIVQHLCAAELTGQRPWEAVIDDLIENLGESQWKRPSQRTDRLYLWNEGISAPIHHPKQQNGRRARKPTVFRGAIASANTLLKNPQKRDSLRDKFGVKAVEMEGSGIADASWIAERGGYLVVRGVCDYCDPSKGDKWHHYAAIVAAAFTLVIVRQLPTEDFTGSLPAPPTSSSAAFTEESPKSLNPESNRDDLDGKIVGYCRELARETSTMASPLFGTGDFKLPMNRLYVSRLFGQDARRGMNADHENPLPPLSERQWLDELARRPFRSIAGEAGMGKSTLLRHLALTFAEGYLKGNSKWVPVFLDLSLLRLNELNDCPNDLNTMCILAGERRLSPKELDYLKGAKRILLLIDGLDEAPPNKSLWDYLGTMVNQADAAIIAGRPWAFSSSKLPQFDSPTSLLFLNHGDVAKYIEDYFSTTPGKANQLLSLIERRPLLLRLLRRPLMLAAFCFLQDSSTSAWTPVSEGDLLTRTLVRMLERRNLPTNYMLEWLGRIAFEQVCASERSTSAERIAALRPQSLDNNVIIAGESPEAIINRSGILQRHPRVPGEYTFAEELFREHLAGSWIGMQTWDYVQEWFSSHAWKPSFSRVLEFMAATIWERNPGYGLFLARWLLKERDEGRDDINDWLALLAARILSMGGLSSARSDPEYQELARKLSEIIIPLYCRRVPGDCSGPAAVHDYYRRLEAVVHQLALIAKRHAVHVLVLELREKGALVAARLLIEIREEQKVVDQYVALGEDNLLRALFDDFESLFQVCLRTPNNSKESRLAIARARDWLLSAGYSNDSAIARCRKLLYSKDTDQDLEDWCIQYLGRHSGDTQLYEWIGERWTTRSVRLSDIFALGFAREPELKQLIVPFLAGLMDGNPYAERPLIFGEICTAFGNLRVPEAAEYLIPQLNHPSREFRRHCARALSATGSALAKSVLQEELAKSEKDLALGLAHEQWFTDRCRESRSRVDRIRRRVGICASTVGEMRYRRLGGNRLLTLENRIDSYHVARNAARMRIYELIKERDFWDLCVMASDSGGCMGGSALSPTTPPSSKVHELLRFQKGEWGYSGNPSVADEQAKHRGAKALLREIAYECAHAAVYCHLASHTYSLAWYAERDRAAVVEALNKSWEVRNFNDFRRYFKKNVIVSHEVSIDDPWRLTYASIWGGGDGRINCSRTCGWPERMWELVAVLYSAGIVLRSDGLAFDLSNYLKTAAGVSSGANLMARRYQSRLTAS